MEKIPGKAAFIFLMAFTLFSYTTKNELEESKHAEYFELGQTQCKVYANLNSIAA